jgi:hypothetical protein
MAARKGINGRCQICKHEHRWRIELLRAGGAGLDALATKFSVSRDAVFRHWRDHVSDEAKATYLAGPGSFETLMERAAEEGDNVLDYLKICRGALLTQLSTMSVAGDSRNVAYVTGHLVRVLETIARVTGEMGDLARSTTYNVTNNSQIVLNSPVFMNLQSMLVRTLSPHPEALSAVLEGLRELDAKASPATNNARTASPTALPMLERVHG